MGRGIPRERNVRSCNRESYDLLFRATDNCRRIVDHRRVQFGSARTNP